MAMTVYRKISVLIPTRHRLVRLRTLLASYDRTTHGHRAQSDLVFRVDEDDPDSANLLLSYGHRIATGPRLRGYQSLPAFFNELLAASDGDVLMCGNDDMIFQTEGWAPAILEAASRYPDGLFDLGVATHNETHYPFSVVSRKATDAMGHLWDPSIHWGDVFLRDVMASFGRIEMLPHVRIDHDWAGHRPDQTFLESDQNITRSDPTYWSGTHLRAVNSAVGKLQRIYENNQCLRPGPEEVRPAAPDGAVAGAEHGAGQGARD